MPLDSNYGAPEAQRQPVFNAPPGTLWLCILIIAAFGLFEMVSEAWQAALADHFAFIPVTFLAQFEPDGSFSAGEWLRLVSYLFLHGDLLHLIVNAGMLLAFGSIVERQIGTVKLLAIFFVSGALAAVGQAIASGPAPIYVIGASGAGYGLIGAGIPLLYAGGVDRGRRDAMLFVVAIMGLNLLFGLTGLGTFITGAQIAWQAHIAGFAAGMILIQLFRIRR